MQKIRVRVSWELEIPDEWKLLPPNKDEERHLMIDGRYFLPDVGWMEYAGESVEGYQTWEEIDTETHEMIGKHLRTVECSIRRVKRFLDE